MSLRTLLANPKGFLSRLTAGTVVVLLAGCEAPQVSPLPEGVSAGDVALFKSAVTDAGCAVQDDTTAAVVENQTGFDTDKLRAITEYLRLAGESVHADPGFRLTTGPCADA